MTLIEIVSPSIKRVGPDCDTDIEKLRATLASRTSLVEIDLFRRGQRTWNDSVGAPGLFTFDPPADYLVVTSRAWERGESCAFQALPIQLTDELPVVSTPFRDGATEATIDLQFCFTLAYEGGPYWRGAVDYDQPPIPPLTDDQQAWARDRIRQWRLDVGAST